VGSQLRWPVAIRDVPGVTVSVMAELTPLVNSLATEAYMSDGAASAARIPAQDWTTRQDTGAHWTDCTDEGPRPPATARTAAHWADGFEEA
jgi:hypothetical protein